jgi:hypothetical protein
MPGDRAVRCDDLDDESPLRCCGCLRSVDGGASRSPEFVRDAGVRRSCELTRTGLDPREVFADAGGETNSRGEACRESPEPLT